MKIEYVVDFLIDDISDSMTFSSKKKLMKFIEYYKTTEDYHEGMNFIVWKKYRGKIQKAWSF